MSIVTTNIDGQAFTFDEDEILDEGLVGDFCPTVAEVAEVLAANLEGSEFRVNDNGTIAIVASNFNDCFEDMMDDLRGFGDEGFGDDEDDES